MALFSDEVLEVINNSDALKSMLYDLNLLPEQVTTDMDNMRVRYLAYWYKANKDKLVKDARGI